MSRAAIQVVIGFSILVGLTAALLLRVQAHYKLGNPGVRVVQQPIFDEQTNVVGHTSVYLPEKYGDFESIAQPVTKPELAMLPPDTVYGRRFYHAKDGFWTTVSVVLMGTDRTSIHKPQYCLLGQGERIIDSEVISIPMSKPYPYELKVMKLTTSSQRAVRKGEFRTFSGLYLYWFVADGQLTPYHGQRMWWQAREMLTRGLLQRWAYVACFSRCEPGREAAVLERMKSFIAGTVPEFQTVAGPREAQRTASAEIAGQPVPAL
jgi:hypothetical protein